MSWLPVMMGLSCKVLALDERWLKRAERIEEHRLARCEGRKCAQFEEALADIHERMVARTQAWTAKECGGPMEST